MSMRQVLDTVDALLKDEALGLTPTTIAFAAQHPEISGAPGPLSADFNFVKWVLPGHAVRPSTRGNVMLAPVDDDTNVRDPGTTRRNAAVVFEIGFETFSGSLDDLQNTLVLVAASLNRVLDTLVDYARDHGGTIYEVTSVRFRYAQYESVTSAGWLATVTALERSYVD